MTVLMEDWQSAAIYLAAIFVIVLVLMFCEYHNNGGSN